MPRDLAVASEDPARVTAGGPATGPVYENAVSMQPATVAGTAVTAVGHRLGHAVRMRLYLGPLAGVYLKGGRWTTELAYLVGRVA